MKIILNDQAGITTFDEALNELTEGAETLSVAVSYLQVGGWQLFSRHMNGLSMPNTRIVCTDQMGITPPAAVKLAQSAGAQIRNYSGDVTYHPKVYLSYDKSGAPKRCLLGSANLSTSAFTGSVEAGVLIDDSAALLSLRNWFNNLFTNRSVEFTAASLQDMENKWLAAAANRARTRLRIRRAMPTLPTAIAPEDLDTLEDVFATVKLPIGLLNMDYAGNNIRNVDRVCEVLANWDNVIAGKQPANDKQRSELNLLGYARGRVLTPLGQSARSRTNEDVARLWCAWLKDTANSDLEDINARLVVAKRVLTQFWHLKDEVQKYFLDHAEHPDDSVRPTLQVIELLCNASDVVQGLSLDDIKALAPLLEQPQRLPDYVRDAVLDYQDNKGTRGWDFPDRRIVPIAWRGL